MRPRGSETFPTFWNECNLGLAGIGLHPRQSGRMKNEMQKK